VNSLELLTIPSFTSLLSSWRQDLVMP
jgi:hypothetical protein